MRSSSIKAILSQFKQEDFHNNGYRNAIYKKEEEKERHKKAKIYYAEKQYKNVRLILRPLVSEEYKTTNVEILKLFSLACMYDPSCNLSEKIALVSSNSSRFCYC